MAKAKKKQKLKTRKVISSRVKITKKGNKKKGKITTRKGGQDHFNARESGKTMRNKRSNNTASKANERNIKRAV